MSQIKLMVKILKQQLKLRGKTYCDVAQHLGVAESSVKRLFMNQGFSVQRLEAVCNLIGLELTDLLTLVDNSVRHITQLSVEKEKALVGDIKLFFICIAALNRWSFDEIVSYYDITPGECFLKMATLDKMNLIDLLPHNKYRVLVSQNFSWQKDGPIQQFFHQNMRNDFFSVPFNQKDQSFICLNGMLTHDNNVKLQEKIQQISETFSELNLDSISSDHKETSGCALVMALRPWVPAIFEKYKR